VTLGIFKCVEGKIYEKKPNLSVLVKILKIYFTDKFDQKPEAELELHLLLRSCMFLQ
jgi:hypothetical protein